MAETHTVLAGEHAETLSAILGVAVEPHHMVTVYPPTFDTQWYADHPEPTRETEGVWWYLANPERQVLTRREIKDTLTELGTMKADLERELTVQRHKALSKKSRTELIDVIPELAARLDQVKTLIARLRQTHANLPRIWADLRYRFNRAPKGD